MGFTKWTTLLIGLIVLLSEIQASSRIPVYQNRETHRSADGEYELTVDPSEMYGAGPGVYTMRSDGNVLWEKELPFTMSDARVTELGQTVGIGYSTGYDAVRDSGELVIALINPNGEVLLEERQKREFSGFTHASPYPTIHDFELFSEQKFAWFLVREKDLNKGDAELVVLDLEGAMITDRFLLLPKVNNGEGRVINMTSIQSTPLLLVEWQSTGSGFIYKGQNLSVIDQSGKVFWKWSGDQETRTLLSGVESAAGREFQFTSSTTHSIMKVESKGSDWEVVEKSTNTVTPTQVTAATPVPTATPSPLVDAPVLNVAPYRTFQLDRPEVPQNQLRIDRSVTFDEFDNIYTTSQNEQELIIRKINKKGLELGFQKISRSQFRLYGGQIIWEEEETLLLVGKAGDLDQAEGPNHLYRFDFLTGELSSVGEIDIWGLNSISPASDGKILVKSNQRKSSNSGSHLRVFDRDGALLLRIDEKIFSENCGNCSVSAACLTTKNEIAVLDSYPPSVHFVNMEGDVVDTILLTESWGYKPNYLSDIYPGLNGGVFVRDFNGAFPIVHMDRSGVVLEQFVDSGIPDPIGRLWVADGYTLKQKSPEGEVLATIGSEAVDELSGDITETIIDQKGRLYILPKRSGIPHVFDQHGKLLFRCAVPANTITNPETAQMKMIVKSDGGIRLDIIERVDSRSKPQVQWNFNFDPEGDLIEHEEILGGMSEKELLFRGINLQRTAPLMNGESIWSFDYHAIMLIDGAGNVIKEIKRNLDGNWLVSPKLQAQAPDGSILIKNSGGSWRSMESKYHVINGQGKAVRSYEKPQYVRSYTSTMAWDGNRIYTSVDDKIIVLDESGQLEGILEVDGYDVSSWSAYITMGGEELWFFDRDYKFVCLKVSDLGLEDN